jgi:hypothetical protein
MKQAAGQGYAAGRIGDVIAVGSSGTREDEWDAVITASRGERGARTWSWKRKTVGDHLFMTGDKSCVTVCALVAGADIRLLVSHIVGISALSGVRKEI